MDGAHTFCALVLSEMQMTERPHQKCDRRGRRRRRSSRSPLHGLLLFEGGAGTLAARAGRIFTSHVEHQRKRRIKKGAVGRDGIAPLPIQRWSSTVTWSAHLSLSLSPSRVRPGTILSHAMHFLSARTRTCRLSVHALRAVATRNKSCDRRALNVLVLSFRPLRLPATPPTGTYCGGCAALTLLYGRLCACYTLV